MMLSRILFGVEFVTERTAKRSKGGVTECFFDLEGAGLLTNFRHVIEDRVEIARRIQRGERRGDGQRQGENSQASLTGNTRVEQRRLNVDVAFDR